MRVGYDARLALGNYRGMGKFLRRLTKERESQLIGLCAADEIDAELNLIAAGPKFYPFWEQVYIPWQAKRCHLDIFIAPYNTGPLLLPRSTALVLVVHDLIFFDKISLAKSTYQNFGRLYRRTIVPRAIKRADLIVTVSHYTEQQLIRRWGREKKILVIPNSLDERWFRQELSISSPARYILVVGGEAPSKNLSRAIEAFACLQSLTADHDRRLKIAGVKPHFHAFFLKQARLAGIDDKVDFLSYVTEEEMQKLYCEAELFLMPSLMEGFGIPVLEAMASGIPVVCSSTSCLPEIGGNAARYFDPLSVAEMASQMNNVLSDQNLQKQMRQMGMIQVQRFHPAFVKDKIEKFWNSLTEIVRSKEGI